METVNEVAASVASPDSLKSQAEAVITAVAGAAPRKPKYREARSREATG